MYTHYTYSHDQVRTQRNSGIEITVTTSICICIHDQTSMHTSCTSPTHQLQDILALAPFYTPLQLSGPRKHTDTSLPRKDKERVDIYIQYTWCQHSTVVMYEIKYACDIWCTHSLQLKLLQPQYWSDSNTMYNIIYKPSATWVSRLVASPSGSAITKSYKMQQCSAHGHSRTIA